MTEAADTNTARPKRKRRWLQFSLRSLMIFTMICAVGSAWVARRMEQKRKDREAVAGIVKLGGEVRYDYQTVIGGQPPGPALLRNLMGDNFFSEVQSVALINNNRADAALVFIGDLTQIQRLDLRLSPVNDVGIANLKTLTQLRLLNLWGTAVADTGLKSLLGMTRLETLYLSDSSVSDVGLQYLKGLTQLKTLGLWTTKVTDAGVEELQKALPNCNIIR